MPEWYVPGCSRLSGSDIVKKGASMKRKSTPNLDPVIAPEILEGAKRGIAGGNARAAAKCVVCGAEATTDAADQLCWVCRRLKISAWRDVEQQLPAQE